jgi:hypothetical protein
MRTFKYFNRSKRRHHEPGLDLEAEREQMNQCLQSAARTGQNAGSQEATRIVVPKRKFEPNPRRANMSGRFAWWDARDSNRCHVSRSSRSGA